jgi:multidrug resistance efflux pump
MSLQKVSAAKAQVEQAKRPIAETNSDIRILSPVDGVVISRNADVGQTVRQASDADSLTMPDY